VADVQVAVRLGREARDDAIVPAGRKVLLDEGADRSCVRGSFQPVRPGKNGILARTEKPCLGGDGLDTIDRYPFRNYSGTSMEGNSVRLILRGVRGTVPTAEVECRGYGGHTCCLEVELDESHRMIVDCGTGLNPVERALTARGALRNQRFDVLMTHFHWDHIIGLPLFAPLYEPSNEFTFYGVGYGVAGVGQVLHELIRPPAFPVALADTPSRKRYVDVGDAPISIGGIEIATARLNHPQGATAYRFRRDGRTVVFATDHERGKPELDRGLLELAHHADVLIHDAQYTPEEYELSHRGWGHSTWQHAAAAARDAEVGRLLLFHHDPDRSDAALDGIVERTAAEFAAVAAAREGESLEL
jgi:phosphoribosyl 1,2-cyclic phosphodiesterase